MEWLWRGGEGPNEIPFWAYKYLVVCRNADPDRLSRCKCVEQLDYFENGPVHVVRIFDPDGTKGVEIRDFASLDPYPALILYEGHLHMASGEIVMSSLRKPA